jgi:hypothetical protein
MKIGYGRSPPATNAEAVAHITEELLDLGRHYR